MDQFGISFNEKAEQPLNTKRLRHQDSKLLKKSSNRQESIVPQSESIKVSAQRSGANIRLSQSARKKESDPVESKELEFGDEEIESSDHIVIPNSDAKTNCLDLLTEQGETATVEGHSPTGQRERPKFRRFIQLTDIIDTSAFLLNRYNREKSVDRANNLALTLHQVINDSKGERNINTCDQLKQAGNSYLNNLFQSNHGE